MGHKDSQALLDHKVPYITEVDALRSDHHITACPFHFALLVVLYIACSRLS